MGLVSSEVNDDYAPAFGSEIENTLYKNLYVNTMKFSPIHPLEGDIGKTTCSVFLETFMHKKHVFYSWS